MEPIAQTNLKPHALLVFYSVGEEGSMDKGYVESHEIINGQVLAGAPLDQLTLDALLKTTVKEKKKNVVKKFGFKGMIPQSIICFQTNMNGEKLKMIWKIPAKEQMMFFSDGLKIPNGTAWQPNLVFFLKGKELNVYAYLGDELNNDTPLLLAPYHNVNNEGNVCLGTVKTKSFEFLDEIAIHYESVFFNSYFSHAAATIVAKLNFNINQLWKDQIQKKCPFPADKLLPLSDFTLQNLISQIND